MKPSSLADECKSHCNVSPSPSDSGSSLDFDDEDDFKDVYYPDFGEVPGETSTICGLRYAFVSAGYRVIRVEEASTHPVLIIRAVRIDSTRHTDPRLLFKHVRNLLRGAGFPLKKDEFTLSQNGNRILVAFPWHDSPINYAAALRQAEEDAAEFEGMPL